MWRITSGRKFSSFAACAVVLLSASAAKAQIQVNIVEPALNATASGSLNVRATVSSVFEVSAVTADVEGRQVNLTYSQPLNAWTNSVPLTGLSFGSHTVVVTAKEFFGGTAQAMQTFRLDNPPRLTVHEPINGTVVNGQVFLSAEAVDDGGNTIISVYLNPNPLRPATVVATNRVQGAFSIAALTGVSQVRFVAADSAGNVSMIARQFVHEPSSNLVTVAVAPGNIFDFDATRFLFSVQEDIVLAANPFPISWPYGRPEPRIQDRQSGHVTSSRSLLSNWIDGHMEDPVHPSFIASGLLGHTGSLLWTGSRSIHETVFIGWNGGVANYSMMELTTTDISATNSIKVIGTTTLGVRRFSGNGGAKLVLQDINESNLLHEVAFPLGTFSSSADLGPNQDLVYVVSNAVYRSRPANPAQPYSNRTTTVLSSSVNGFNRRVATDGANVAYDSGGNIQLITSTGEETLAAGLSFPFPDFRLRNGWAAYTKLGNSGQTQIWTRSPAGTQQQRTFFNASSTLESLGPSGQITFLNDNVRYVSLPGVLQPIWVNSGQGRVRWDNGNLVVILGRSVLEFRMGRLQCAALASGGSRLTFSGPNGFSYTVQGSADLRNWNDLWTFAHTTGSISWTNPPASAHSFYRAVTASSP